MSIIFTILFITSKTSDELGCWRTPAVVMAWVRPLRKYRQLELADGGSGAVNSKLAMGPTTWIEHNNINNWQHAPQLRYFLPNNQIFLIMIKQSSCILLFIVTGFQVIIYIILAIGQSIIKVKNTIGTWCRGGEPQHSVGLLQTGMPDIQ